MKTIRDNYYIITGHTYEEYLKKYRYGIGKGKLLTFNEDEVKYLRKNKFYWEVIGPEGKVVYCQVHRVKAKHIIIPLVIAGVIGGGAAAGAIYLPKLFNKFDGKVTEAEWKDSFENILHVNDSTRKLNYKTSSIFSFEDLRSNGAKYNYKDLVVDGDYEEAYDTDNKKTLYRYEYNHLPLQYYEGESSVTVEDCMIRDTFSFMFGDMYTTQESFTFDSDSKCYKYSTDEEAFGSYTLKGVNSTISFASTTHIKKVTCSYSVYNDKKEEISRFSGSFEYEYGTASLKAWEKDVQDKLKERTFGVNAEVEKNKLTTDANNNLVTQDNALNQVYKDKGAIIVTLDYTKEKIPTGLKYFKLYKDSTEITFWPEPNSLKIFRNDVLLERGEGWNFTFRDSDKHVIGFNLVEPTTKTDVITAKFSFTDYLVEDCKLMITANK